MCSHICIQIHFTFNGPLDSPFCSKRTKIERRNTTFLSHISVALATIHSNTVTLAFVQVCCFFFSLFFRSKRFVLSKISSYAAELWKFWLNVISSVEYLFYFHKLRLNVDVIYSKISICGCEWMCECDYSFNIHLFCSLVHCQTNQRFVAKRSFSKSDFWDFLTNVDPTDCFELKTRIWFNPIFSSNAQSMEIESVSSNFISGHNLWMHWLRNGIFWHWQLNGPISIIWHIRFDCLIHWRIWCDC